MADWADKMVAGIIEKGWEENLYADRKALAGALRKVYADGQTDMRARSSLAVPRQDSKVAKRIRALKVKKGRR